MNSSASLFLPISPTPTSTSYNLNSASHGHKDNQGARRYGNITRNLNKLKSTNHLIALQETKLDPFENKALQSVFHGWGRCYSNAPASGNSNRAGVMLLIAPVLCKAYEINQFDLGAPTHGHIQAVLFTPKDPNSELEGFLFINVYLATGARNGISDAARKFDQLAPFSVSLPVCAHLGVAILISLSRMMTPLASTRRITFWVGQLGKFGRKFWIGLISMRSANLPTPF
jgi:hypothetical protein